MMNIQDIIAKIKEKKSLQGISNQVISKELDIYFKKERISISTLSPKDEKIIVQDIRAKLRKLSGSFNYEKDDPSQQVLVSHSSTRERVEFYDELKNRLDSLNVKSILDLGCGINPLALAEQGVKYYAYDINEKNLDLVKKYFNENNIQGVVEMHDLRDKIDFPKVDLCIMFKLLDILDEKDHKLSEKIITNIDCKYLLISFSTKTLSGAPMRHPQRGWIELLLNRLGYSFDFFSSNNEIFYLAKKRMSSS